MESINHIINSCEALTGVEIRTIASYSHAIPAVLSLFLAVFIFIKSKYNFFSKIFLFFVASFSLWLLGDMILWTSNNYYLIYSIWSTLVYIEIIFYMLGLYFALVYVYEKDLSKYLKVLFFLIFLPVFYISITGSSVIGFEHSICEAENNRFLDIYKLIVEAFIGVVFLFLLIKTIITKNMHPTDKRADLIVLGATMLFLSVFGITEYISSTTGIYEINLYSLFILPIFLLAIIYSVFELDIFKFNVLGTHYIVVGLMILIFGQLFFVSGSVDKILTLLTLVFAFGLSIIMFRNYKRESAQREHIEKLNIELQSLIIQRESLMHLITHKVKGAFTRSKYIFAGLLDGSFGAITEEVRKISDAGLKSDNAGINTIDLILNASNLQKGTVKFDEKEINFKDLFNQVFNEKKSVAEMKNLKLEQIIEEGEYMLKGDPMWIKEVINNLVSNAISYTKEGGATMSLAHVDGGKMIFKVKDTGVGISEEDKKVLFTEGGRGKDSTKVNVDSTGYGLFTVKLVAGGHGGRVWAESEGAGKGSTFCVELPLSS